MQEPVTAAGHIYLTSAILLISLVAAIAIIVLAYSKKVARQKEELFMSIIAAQESERQRIGRDLHDDSGALLSSLKQQIQDVARPDDTFIITLIEQTIASLRIATHNLCPPTLEEHGLDNALAILATNLCKKSGTAITVSSSSQYRSLQQAHAVNLYRVATELINNALKHGQASEIKVNISDDGDLYNVVVTDNGRGLPVVTGNTGIGLTSVKNRLKLMKGHFSLESAQGRTVAKASVPHSQIVAQP